MMRRFFLFCVLCGALFGSQLIAQQKSVPSYKEKYVAQNYSYLLDNPKVTKGLGAETLKLHFKLYEGYVKNTNLVLSLLQQLEKEGKQRTPVWADLKRRFGWEFDGMRLHEFYFSAIGGDGKIDQNSALYKRIVEQWGSYDAWKQDFIDTGAMRGIGWALLYQDPETGRLMNFWINEHDHGHLAGGTILLPMDVFEHAYLLEYGLDRMGYINAFMDNLDWGVIQKRYDIANPQS